MHALSLSHTDVVTLGREQSLGATCLQGWVVVAGPLPLLHHLNGQLYLLLHRLAGGRTPLRPADVGRGVRLGFTDHIQLRVRVGIALALGGLPLLRADDYKLGLAVGRSDLCPVPVSVH